MKNLDHLQIRIILKVYAHLLSLRNFSWFENIKFFIVITDNAARSETDDQCRAKRKKSVKAARKGI